MIRTNNYFNVFSSSVSYACLLACGLYISRNAFDQYQEGRTAFHETKHPLTLEDLPSITICYKKLDWSLFEQFRSNISAVARDWMISYKIEINLHELQNVENITEYRVQR